MCRHLVWLGARRPLASLLHDPPHSLEHQSHKTFEQRWVTMNADGWGVGWWDPEAGDTPARYRTDKPMWADRSFRSVADVVRSGAFVAAVRAATPGTPVVETGSAPFASGPWLFSLNGYVSDFPGPAADRLRRRLSPARSAALEGTTDSEVLFGLVLDLVDEGVAPEVAAARVAADVLAGSTGELNLLLSDGRHAIATTGGNTLYALVDAGLAEGGTLLASEPLDDHEGWTAISDRALVVATADGYRTEPLTAAEGAA
ncbi:MAG: ergothioneine biosynthesis protein EgtC [Acidimicrobiia bacterium]